MAVQTVGAQPPIYQKLVTNVGNVSAGETINIPNNYTTIIIEDDSASAANAVSLPTGVNGQIIYIYNGDAQATSGDIIIPPGYLATLIYIQNSWKTIKGIVG
jgi:hypothetical protein